jgi:hypothetical protein
VVEFDPTRRSFRVIRFGNDVVFMILVITFWLSNIISLMVSRGGGLASRPRLTIHDHHTVSIDF